MDRNALLGRLAGRGRAKPSTISSGYGSQQSPSSTPPLSAGRDARPMLQTELAGGFQASTSSRGEVRRDTQEGNSSMSHRILSEDLQKCKLVPLPAALSSRSTEVVKAQGSCGERVRVQTNCVKLTYQNKRSIHQYDVKIYPTVDDSKTRYKLVSLAVTFKRGIRCYNGDAILYLPYRVDESVKIVELDGTKYEITIKLTANLSVEESLPFLGTLVRNCCKAIGFNLVGRNYYDLKSEQTIAGHNYKVWSGFITAVDEKEDGVYLTVDTSSRVLRTDTVYATLKKLKRDYPDSYINMAMKNLVGVTVITLYNNLMYRIDDILWKESPAKTTFKLLDGTEISIKDYIKKQHNLELLDDHQPILVSKCRRRGPFKDQMVHLVPELCNLTGITDEMRQDYRVMKELASYTQLDPKARNRALKSFLAKIKDTEESRNMLNDWGLDIADEGLEMDARILESVKMTFGRNVKDTVQGNWKSTNAPYRGADIRQWVIFYLARDEVKVREFLTTLYAVARGLDVVVDKPQMCVLPNDRVATLVPALERNTDKDTQIIALVMGNQRSDIYAAVKKFCICEKPMASQVILSYTISKPQRLRAITNNILLQMVAKLGGALWKVEMKAKDTMFCGIDTFHDKGGKHSVAGFVASIDKDSTKYFSQVALQDPKIDLMLSAYRSVTASINAYYAENGKPPNRIFVFRDGVGVGDYNTAHREIAQLKSACSHYRSDYEPQLVFVLCVKRINLRYFSMNETNAQPGTIVDSRVTMRTHQDFMLVSQKSTQGTLTPTHYVVILNESNLKIDQIQMITHWFCHMYYNWSGAVRVPAPCLYAHKLAGLIGVIQKYPHEFMENNLYYL